MNRGLLIGLGVVAVVIVFAGLSAYFTVHQTEQALVLQFGKPVKVEAEPGLHFKVPFIQNVTYFDRRVLDLDNPAEEVIASDQKRLVVDAFARYRIIDPLKFFQAVRTEAVARTRLSVQLNAAMREVIGGVTLSEVVSGERAALMGRIRDLVNAEAKQFGVDVIDVRIKRGDLPEANSQAVFRRMQTEREREAKEFRAQGERRAVEIRAGADRTRVETVAEAEKQADIIRGEGDGEAVRVFAGAFGRDPEFYAFYRSMEAYRNALGSDDTTMVLSPDSEFFRFFGNIAGEAAKAAAPK